MSEYGGFKYGETNLDEIAKERQQLEDEKKRSGFNYFQIKEGRNVLRILPSADPAKHTPFHKVWVHYVRNPSKPGTNGRPVMCPSKNNNARCIVCEKVSALRRSANEIDKEIAGDLAASRQIYANVVDLQEPERGVQVMKFGVMIYNDLLAYMDKSDPSAVGDLAHPEKGYNVVIDRKGKGKQDTRYQVRTAKEASPIPKKQWLGEMNNLSAVVEEMANDKIQAIMEGRDPDADFDPKALEAGADKPASSNIDDDAQYTPPRART